MRASAIRFPQGRSAGVPASYSLGSKLGECFTAYMVLVPLLLSVAAAAVQTPMASAPPPQTNTQHHSRRLFISPMGEPFRSNSRDDDTLADWFQQADRNHDGKLTLEEMQQDAERFFAFLDVNHDGEIDPDEITRYESEIAPEVRTREDFAAELAGSGDGEHSDREGGDRAVKADTGAAGTAEAVSSTVRVSTHARAQLVSGFSTFPSPSPRRIPTSTAACP